jgi:hypothetical protein
VIDGGGGRLLEDADDVEAGELTGLACGLDLGRVEVGGHGDDGADDGRVEGGVAGLERLCGERFFHAIAELDEDLRRDLLGRELVGPDGDGRLLAHLALDGLDRRCAGAALGASGVPDDEGVGLVVPRHGGGHGAPAEAIGVDDELALGGRKPGDLGVGRPEIDADSAVEEGHGAARVRELGGRRQARRRGGAGGAVGVW